MTEFIDRTTPEKKEIKNKTIFNFFLCNGDSLRKPSTPPDGWGYVELVYKNINGYDLFKANDSVSGSNPCFFIGHAGDEFR